MTKQCKCGKPLMKLHKRNRSLKRIQLLAKLVEKAKKENRDERTSD